MSFIAKALAFLAEHYEIVEAVYEMISKGASKESIKRAILSAEIEASDAVMREELDLPPK